MSVLNLSFNETTSCLSCSTNSGFIIYGLKPSLEKKYITELNGGVGLIRQLKSTNILGLIGGGDDPFRAKDTVVIWNDHKKSTVLEIELHEPVKNLYVTNKKIIIVVEKRILVAAINNGDINCMKDTYSNEDGICKFSNKDDSLVIATLGTKKGEVAVWKLKSDRYSTIQAHTNNITAIALNNDGSLVATASESGTNVHVYSTETGKELYKFRRGTKSAKIYDITFDNDSKYLACCSNTGTLHIFEMYKAEKDAKNTRSSLSYFQNYLPEYFSSHWSFQQVYIGDMSKMTCSFDDDKVLHIATVDGNYFRISEKEGVYDQVKRSGLFVNQKQI